MPNPELIWTKRYGSVSPGTTGSSWIIRSNSVLCTYTAQTSKMILAKWPESVAVSSKCEVTWNYAVLSGYTLSSNLVKPEPSSNYQNTCQTSRKSLHWASRLGWLTPWVHNDAKLGTELGTISTFTVLQYSFEIVVKLSQMCPVCNDYRLSSANQCLTTLTFARNGLLQQWRYKNDLFHSPLGYLHKSKITLY